MSAASQHPGTQPGESEQSDLQGAELPHAESTAAAVEPLADGTKPRRGILPTRYEAFAALLSGGLFAIAFPPFNWLVPALICLVPLAVCVAKLADSDAHGWSATRAGFWFGIIGYGANLYWIAIALLLYTKLALLGYLGTLVWLAPMVAITATALFTARRLTGWPLAILLPVVWVASEVMLNYLSDLAFPWLPLGLSTSRLPILAQFADISGVRGVSFWIAAVNGLLADAWLWKHDRKASLVRVIGAAAVVGVAALYGAWRMSSITLTPFARVAVVQPNIPEEAKLHIEDPTTHVAILAQMTRRELVEHQPQLVFWPEAALDRFIMQYPNWLDSLRAVAMVRPTPIITGFLDIDTAGYYNAATITDSFGRIGFQPSYKKQYLVPIVERVPFLNPEWFKGMNYFGGFGRGTSEAPFETPIGKVGMIICYESIFSQLSRAYARQGAVLLANITNDAWFQRSTAPYQHIAHLPLRAIETRLPVVRAANTGISAYIDPLGRVRAETPLFVPYSNTFTIESAHTTTLYTRIGDWIGWLCLTATIVMLLAAWRQRRASRAAAA